MEEERIHDSERKDGPSAADDAAAAKRRPRGLQEERRPAQAEQVEVLERRHLQVPPPFSVWANPPSTPEPSRTQQLASKRRRNRPPPEARLSAPMRVEAEGAGLVHMTIVPSSHSDRMDQTAVFLRSLADFLQPRPSSAPFNSPL